jgi:hypothetical protein
VRDSLGEAILMAVAVEAPAARIAAIRARERALGRRVRGRRKTLALAALLLSFAGLALAAGERTAPGGAHPPAPVASMRPFPTVT